MAPRERYARTLRTAARISSGGALSPALSDMCDQTMSPPGRMTSEPPSCAALPTVRVCDPVAARAGEEALRHALRAEQLGHARDLGSGGPVADPLLIGEHRKLDPLPPAELGGVARSRLSDQDETDAGCLELTPGAIQLDRVILAEDSPVVPEPDERRRALVPQVAETDVVAIVVGQDDVRELVRAGRGARFVAGGHAVATLLRDTPSGGGSRAKASLDALPGVDRAHDADALPGVAEREARPAVRGLPRRCGAGRSRDLEAFWGSLVEFFGRAVLRAGASGCSGGGRCRARSGSRARGSATPSTCSRGKDPDAFAIQHASELRALASMTWGELRALTASIAAGLRASGVGEGDRVAAYMPNIPETVAALSGVCLDRRDLVVGRARVRRPERGRPLRADRAQGAAGRRRLPLRRQGLRPLAMRSSRSPPRSRRCRGSCGSGTWTGRAGSTGSSEPGDSLEFAQLPFDHPLWVLYSSGHDRAAEADRPRPGRDPARAPEEGASAPRRPGRRPDVLVHDDRLDDVELPRRRAAHRRVDRAVRRQSRVSDARDVCGIWPRTPG